MLRKLSELPKNNEATLAALLSHELAHILLGHSALTKLSKKLDLMVQSAGVTAAAAQVYGDSSDEGASDALGTYASTQVATMLWSDLMRTRNDREEEKKADELGSDLTLAAGFDSIGWEQLFLDILKEAAAKLSARMTMLEQLIQRGGATEVQKQAFDWFAKLNVSHPPTSVRDENRKDYEGEHYGEARTSDTAAPRALGKFETALRAGSGAEVLKLDSAAFDLQKALRSRDPKKAAELFALLTKDPKSMQPRALLVAAQYAEAQKDFAKAESLLASLTAARYPPASGYLSLASVRGKKLNDPPGAIDALDAAVTKLRTKRPFLPLLAGMHLKTGNTEVAENYAQLCGCPASKLGFLSGDTLARKLLGEQTDDLNQQCIKELGYDVAAKTGDQGGLFGGASAAGRKLLGIGKCFIDP